MNRRYPDKPMVGVAAVIFREDRVLLVQRGRPPAYGKWSLPGGLVELGESLKDALQREVLEEVGLVVRVIDLVAALDRVVRDSQEKIEYHYILLDFLCVAEDGEPSPASDVLACAFVPLSTLGAYGMSEGTEQVIHRVYERERGQPAPVYDPHL